MNVRGSDETSNNGDEERALERREWQLKELSYQREIGSLCMKLEHEARESAEIVNVAEIKVSAMSRQIETLETMLADSEADSRDLFDALTNTQGEVFQLNQALIGRRRDNAAHVKTRNELSSEVAQLQWPSNVYGA